MKKIVSILVIFLIFVVFVSCGSQKKVIKTNNGTIILKMNTVDILEIKNEQFSIMLDSIIESTTKYFFYNPELIFKIKVYINDDLRYLVVPAGNIISNEKWCGMLKYKGHLFFVDKLATNLFIKTEKKESYFFVEKQKMPRKVKITGIKRKVKLNERRNHLNDFYFYIIEKNGIMFLER